MDAGQGRRGSTACQSARYSRSVDQVARAAARGRGMTARVPLDHLGQPDLASFVRQYGGWECVPPQAWSVWTRATVEWQARRRDRSAEAPPSDRADPGRPCICGSAGDCWRPRKDGGRTIWRCEAHRDQWPEYAEDFPLQEAAG